MIPFRNSPISIPEAIDLAVRQTLWREGPSSRELERASRDLEALWPKLAVERGQVKKAHYSTDTKFTETYGRYYFLANVMKMPAVLAEMAELGVALPESLRWMDLGCGPGTALIGAWWALQKHAPKFVGVDQSAGFLTMVKNLAGASARAAGEKFELETVALDVNERKVELAGLLRRHQPNVISLSNSISEWGSTPAERAAWMLELMQESERQRREEFSYIIIVEPGSKAASRDLLSMREIWRNDEWFKRRAQILLPCFSDRPCGALASPGDWCHEEVSAEMPEWHQKLGELAGLRKEQLLFSYLVIRLGKPLEHWPLTVERVVSSRMKEKGLTKCFLCTPGGKKLARVLDSRVTEENSVIQNCNRGDLYVRVELSAKGDVLGVEKLPPR